MWQKIFKILLVLFLIPSLCWAGIDFDGTDDEVNCSNNSSLNFTTENFTISAWVKTSNIATQGLIFCRGLWTVDGYYLQFYNSVVEFSINNGGTQQFANSQTLLSNIWYHIVGRRTGTDPMQIFINGVEATYGTQETAINPLTSSRNAYIGQYDNKASNLSFLGIITEVAIWSTALTTSEITQLANSKIKGMPLQIQSANLKGYWAMNDQPDGTSADADTVRDLSGNNNSGTGNDGANNTGLIWKAEEILSYMDEFAQ